MRRIFFISLMFTFICAFAQPTSIEYQKNDFFLLVMENPTFSLCDFKDNGINSRNTELDTEAFWVSRTSQTFHKLMMKAVGRDDYQTRVATYRKIAAAWRVYLEIQYTKDCIHLYNYIPNIPGVPKEKMDEVTRHRLSIVPLKLTKY